jgi:hypothetical protein
LIDVGAGIESGNTKYLYPHPAKLYTPATVALRLLFDKASACVSSISVFTLLPKKVLYLNVAENQKSLWNVADCVFVAITLHVLPIAQGVNLVNTRLSGIASLPSLASPLARVVPAVTSLMLTVLGWTLDELVVVRLNVNVHKILYVAHTSSNWLDTPVIVNTLNAGSKYPISIACWTCKAFNHDIFDPAGRSPTAKLVIVPAGCTHPPDHHISLSTHVSSI